MGSRSSRQFLMGLAAAVSIVALAGCGEPAAKLGGGEQVSQPNGDAPAGPATASPASAGREGWPTEEEAKAAIFKVEYAIHASQTNKDVWHVKDMKHDVHSVKFADRTTQKQMNYGVGAITVYPAKIRYTRITEYDGKEATRDEEGDDGVWFLYQDSFGEWTGKYGTE